MVRVLPRLHPVLVPRGAAVSPDLERALFRLWRAARKCDPALTDIALEEPGRSIARAVEAVEGLATGERWTPPLPQSVLDALASVSGEAVGEQHTPEAPMLPLGKNARTVSPPDPAEGAPCGKPSMMSRICHPNFVATRRALPCPAFGSDGLCHFRHCSRNGLTPWPDPKTPSSPQGPTPRGLPPCGLEEPDR